MNLVGVPSEFWERVSGDGRQLFLAGMRLASVPEWLGNLTALTRLNLHGNQLTALPIRLADLLAGSLQLGLGGNPLADPLPELAERGAAEFAAYLRSLYDAEPQYEAKLLLVGEGNVGKTSLIAALRSAPFVDGRPTTHGIEITPPSILNPSAGRDMTVRGWDFGGQEVYRITHQFFFTSRAVYVVAWNARQGQEQDEVEGWLRRVRLRVGRDARALLVATHCAERRPELDYPHLERAFPGMLAGTFETDSRTGLGIDQLRLAIGAEAARLPQMGQLWSPRWVAAREDILDRGKTEPQIWYEQFAATCDQYGLSELETSTLAKLMHDLGLIIYYSDDEGLRDIVVLNPEWLTKAISYVLEDSATRQDGGIPDHARLRQVWHDRNGGYEPRYHPYYSCRARRASFAPIRSFEVGVPESVLSMPSRRSSSASRSSCRRRSSRSAPSWHAAPRSPRPSPPLRSAAAHSQHEARQRHQAQAQRARAADSHTRRRPANRQTQNPAQSQVSKPKSSGSRQYRHQAEGDPVNGHPWLPSPTLSGQGTLWGQ